jgi:hypothetical protein
LQQCDQMHIPTSIGQKHKTKLRAMATTPQGLPSQVAQAFKNREHFLLYIIRYV